MFIFLCAVGQKWFIVERQHVHEQKRPRSLVWAGCKPNVQSCTGIIPKCDAVEDGRLLLHMFTCSISLIDSHA